MNKRITPYDPELAKSITKEGQRIVRELSHSLEDKISMNERIRELAEQARKYARDYVADCKHYGYYMEHNEYELRFEEKFTELIILECCRYLDNEAERLYTLYGSEVDPVFQSNFEICAEKCHDNSQGLKDHFGVK